MTEPKDPQRESDERDELELDAETIKDLEADEESGAAVRGGGCQTRTCPYSTEA